MTTVLITGATGFIGRSLAPLLQRSGMRTLGVSRAGAPTPGFDAMIAARLGDTIAPIFTAERVDAIVHGALAVGPNARDTNVEGTTRWLEEARTAGVPLQILLSSLSADPNALSEDGRAKYALEQRFIRYGEVVFRLGVVVGDGGMFARVLSSARRTPIVPMLDGGKQPLHVLGIEFLCKVLRDAIDDNGQGLRARAWNLQQPRAHSLHEVTQAICRGYHLRRLILPIPAAPVIAVLEALEKLPFARLPITSAAVQEITQTTDADIPSDFPLFGYPEESLEGLIATQGPLP